MKVIIVALRLQIKVPVIDHFNIACGVLELAGIDYALSSDWSMNPSGKFFQRVFKGEIDSKLDNLLIPHESEIQTQAKNYAKTEAANRYHRILNEASKLKSDIHRYFTLDKTGIVLRFSTMLCI